MMIRLKVKKRKIWRSKLAEFLWFVVAVVMIPPLVVVWMICNFMVYFVRFIEILEGEECDRR